MLTQVVTDAVIHFGGLALIHGTALALMTYLLSLTLLRRCRAAVQATLWTIVLVKFLLPPVLPGELAMSGWIARAAKSATAALPLESASPHTPQQPIAGFVQAMPAESILAAVGRSLFACYLLGVTLLSIRVVLALRRTRRRIRALPFCDKDMRDEVLTLAARIGVKHEPDIRSAGDETTPYVYGLRRVVLVLPQRMMRMLEPREREGFILHELAHIRRKDQLVRWIESLACVLFFFFPPVRWVCRRIEHFTEMACDGWAISVSEAEPRAYASALVRVVKRMRPAPQAEAGLPLVRDVRLLEERLRTLLRNDAKKSPRLSTGAKAVLIGWSLFALTGGSPADTVKPTPNLAQVSVAHDAPSSDEPEINKLPVVPPSVRLKGSPTLSGAASHQPNPYVRRHGESGQYASHGVQTPEKPTFSRNGQAPEEGGAIGSPMNRGATLPPLGNGLSPYEEGFLLGNRYAKERARWSQDAAGDGPTKRDGQSVDQELKRELEMRMQVLTGQPLHR